MPGNVLGYKNSHYQFEEGRCNNVDFVVRIQSSESASTYEHTLLNDSKMEYVYEAFSRDNPLTYTITNTVERLYKYEICSAHLVTN